jgi:zinc-ribbons
MENKNKNYYCPTCNGELEMLSGCGAVGYFCNHCRKLVSRNKMLSEPIEKLESKQEESTSSNNSTESQ